MKLPISEIFTSIQGEGKYTGVPSLFIRVSGCPLRCAWCDTPYTSWQPETNQMDVEAVFEKIAASKCPHVVLTGGEPMLFVEQMESLVNYAQDVHGKTVTIETSGVRYSNKVKPDLWSVSPKLKSSYPDFKKHTLEWEKHNANLDHAALSKFIVRGSDFEFRDVQYKFVVTCPDDVCEVLSLVSYNGLPVSKVWLMPEGRTREEVLDKAGWVAEHCKANGFNLSMRVHTLIWGNRRGV